MQSARRRGLGVGAAIAFGALVGLGSATVAVGCANHSGSPSATVDAAVDSRAPSVDSTTPADSGAADSTLHVDSSVDSTPPPPKEAAATDSSDAADASGDAIADAIEDTHAEVGTPCDASQATQTQTCGSCGTQTSTCEGQPPRWSPYGACQGQVTGGCVPDATMLESCGICGTRMIVCGSDCEYAVSACTGQVEDGCAPGAVTFVPDPTCGDSGPAGSLQTCGAMCSWDAGTRCQAAPTSLVAAPTAGAVVDTEVVFQASAVIEPLENGTPCPQVLADAAATAETPYAYVPVTNGSTSGAVVVSIWASQAPMGPTIDTMLTAYTGQSPPNTPLLREHCIDQVTDSCMDMSDPTSCLPGWGGLMAGDNEAITIPAGASIVVFVNALHPSGVGPLLVHVRTESFL